MICGIHNVPVDGQYSGASTNAGYLYKSYFVIACVATPQRPLQKRAFDRALRRSYVRRRQKGEALVNLQMTRQVGWRAAPELVNLTDTRCACAANFRR